MQIITDPTAMQRISEDLRMKHQLIAVVMTMGALHEGHISLVREAKKQAGTVILTIFVNPSQFGPSEDFHRYPRPFDKDAAMAKSAGVDYLFAPEPDLIYPEGFQTSVATGSVAERFEGALRPGHFNGVATVVLKLMMLTRPHLAIFGQKDAQQLAVLRTMVRDLNLNVRILEAPIIREHDGLAVSSRNMYLSTSQRELAPLLYKTLTETAARLAENSENYKEILDASKERLSSIPAMNVEYLAIVDRDTFVETRPDNDPCRCLLIGAVRLGGTRLLDNVQLPPRKTAEDGGA
ncbi:MULTISPECIES: pantoate--beta-alanine ligase [Prosthecochloris]|uniref:Pantothenate synthetase n=1 Tax=Prosthecochloris vibrioformis TaxID=1098 RepID=A0A5C4S179_PROVB|nr:MULTISPECIES: pantoate--beta-alanine ligase [Prosthecochloris]ANT64335.1 Pantothenate synthetase [Prosthecochloris sp. CIB 2401]TNJ37194.1 pantoate--beta-alanine ligase [Prosthecochloris vibrioformis]